MVHRGTPLCVRVFLHSPPASVCCACVLRPPHPLCSQLDGLDVRSVGNSQLLKETALIEAFNLKAAIEMQLKNMPAAAEALADMPPR